MVTGGVVGVGGAAVTGGGGQSDASVAQVGVTGVRLNVAVTASTLAPSTSHSLAPTIALQPVVQTTAFEPAAGVPVSFSVSPQK